MAVRQRRTRPQRKRRRITVRFRRQGTSDPFRNGFTDNISSTGLFIQTGCVHPPGTAVELEISLEDGQTKLQGIVQWARKAPPSLARALRSGMGIRLVKPMGE
ncbi:MAG: PilZ domain-containing protein [Acidobacteriota bacterium]